MRLLLLCAFLLVASPLHAADSGKILGTWKLVSVVYEDAQTKERTPVLGEHPHGYQIATPEGRLSRYFYGVEYAPRDVRLGLVEASQNKIGNPVDQILLFCYHYDAATGKYGAVVMNMVRFAGAAFALIGGIFLAIVLRRDFRADQRILRRVG